MQGRKNTKHRGVDRELPSLSSEEVALPQTIKENPLPLRFCQNKANGGEYSLESRTGDSQRSTMTNSTKNNNLGKIWKPLNHSQLRADRNSSLMGNSVDCSQYQEVMGVYAPNRTSN